MQTYPMAESYTAAEGQRAVMVAPTNRISWGAIFAGAVIALAIGLMLNMLGVAVGASLVDTAARNGPAASSIGLGAAAWMLVSNLIALFVGGYAAARLSGTADGTDGTLHGVAVWAATLLVSTILLGNLIASVATSAIGGASSVLGGLAHGGGSAISAVGRQVVGTVGGGTLPAQARSLLSEAQGELNASPDPANMNAAQRRGAIAKLIRKRIVDGHLSAADHSELDKLVAAELGVSRQQAEQRIAQAERRAEAAIAQAKTVARATAKTAAHDAAITSATVFVTMLLGMGVAVLGSRSGTRAMAVPVGPARRAD